MSLGNRIKECRRLNNLTQKELSSQLGLTAKMVSFYELNQRIPPIDIVVKLSEIFSVSTDYLLGLIPNQSSVVDYPENNLSSEEKVLLDLYRNLDKDYKDIVLGELKKCTKLQKLEHKGIRKEA